MVTSMEYTNYQYESYLALKYCQDKEMETYVNECLLLSECAPIEEIKALHESFAQTLKEMMLKVKNAIFKFWNHFLESMNTLVKKDKAYLEKYKDIILKKEVKDATYTMYNYPKGIKVLLSTPVPAFNFESMKESLIDDKTFNEKYFPTIRSKINGEDDTLQKAAINVFRGGDDTMDFSSEQINMTDIYNYCYRYNEIAEAIQKDVNNVQDAYERAIKVIEKADRESKLKQPETQTPTTSGSDQEKKEGNESKNESYAYDDSVYSVVYEAYIKEEIQISDNKSGAATSSGSSSSGPTMSGTTDPKKAYTKIDNESKKKLSADDLSSEKEAKEYTKMVNVYNTACGGIMSAKETVAEECYKDYMSIIKYHVRALVGDKEAKSKAQDAATDQSDTKDNSKKDKVEEVKSGDAKDADGKSKAGTFIQGIKDKLNSIGKEDSDK